MTEDIDPWLSEEEDGSTPVEEEDRECLIPDWVKNRGELNAAEWENIVAAQQNAKWGRMVTSELLDDVVIRALHQAMFCDVWTWAGQYRRRDVRPGIDWEKVPEAVRQLVENTKVRIEHTPVADFDELACQLHHRLVQIHPFNNGNGRFARLYTDYFLRAVGLNPFSWGQIENRLPADARQAYISALREADQGEIEPLRRFLRPQHEA